MKLNKLPLNVIGLNRVGLNQIGSPSHRANTSDRPYIDPEVLASLVAVCICDGKSNDDPDRAVIKNLVDPDNPFIISNAAFKLNSGYGKYIEDFSLFTLSNRFEYSEISNTKVTITAVLNNSTGIYHPVAEEESAIYWNTFKIKVSGSTDDVYISYTTINKSIRLYNGINTVVVPNELSWHSFVASTTNVSCNITLEFVSEYEGAFVTDGKDDLITSTKTVKEMLGGSNEVTVVSMVHQIGLSSLTTINNIRSESVAHVVCRNICSSAGKTGIYGYSRQINTNNPPTLINNILGDKKDYTAEGNSALDPTDKFFVQGYKYSGSISEVSQIAYYWTIIANKVLTTDQINQVISYFNLDKHVKPDIIYDTIRQGITNENHASFNDELVDFSGNGHNMKIYNSAWKLDSGVGKYEVDFNTWTPQSYVADSTYTSNKLHITNIKGGNAILYTKKGTNAMKVKITGIQSFNLVYRYITENDVWEALEVDRDGIYELPASTTTTKTYYTGFTVPYYTGDCDITIEQIPDYEGALVSDGIDDYGKVTGVPIYKDYTVVADRTVIGTLEQLDGGVSAKCTNYLNGSFVMDYKDSAFSFGGQKYLIHTLSRIISYQSKYISNGKEIVAGNSSDVSDLYVGKLGIDDRYSAIALYSYLLFPYTLSEFLIERQLKRYKLGTLYPDMVEWRPIISSNIPYDKIEFFDEQWTKRIYPGDYVEIGATIKANLYLNNYDISTITSLTSSQFESVYIDRKGQYYDVVLSGIKKSPQKINITIDEYIRYENIVQPYPAIINLKQDGKTITWGDKLKVGSDIVFVGSANLLPELYTVSETRYNGVTLYPNTIIKVEKSMVFDNARTYLKANEPNCILSPNRLRIPNSSYKILGYIPDLTGKGNHGVINNSAYAGMSGANRYVYNWNTWRISKNGITSTITDSSLHITSLKGQYNPNQALFEPNTVANAGDKSNFKVNITGLTSDMKCTFNNAGSIMKELVNGVNEISVDLVAGWYGFMITSLDGSVIGDCDITIQQIGQYEGSFCFDGTDDHITIPTLAHGSKCMLMKVNWNKDALMLYDQRRDDNPNSFAIYIPNFNNNEDSIAYSSRNDGKTYIDGVLNTSVKGSQLKDVTHNITITNSNSNNDNTVSPAIGSNAKYNAFYAQMALFDFMLFPEIPSEDEIKELNDVMGIENNIEVS